jgi:predicted SprT family Zn-dependent metalloprotease
MRRGKYAVDGIVSSHEASVLGRVNPQMARTRCTSKQAVPKQPRHPLRSLPVAAAASRDCLTLVRKWFRLWGVARGSATVSIEFSARLSRTLGRCRPSSGTLTLSQQLLAAGREALLRAVLCHEAAHLANRILYGRRAAPHGERWRGLVETAGFEACVRMEVPWDVAPRGRSARAWEHRCPRCGALRIARRAVAEWRCDECVTGGGDGRLIVERRPEPQDLANRHD